MVLLKMLLASHDANACTNGVSGPKSHIGCHFDHLDLRYTVASLMMLSALHYADTNANGIT